MRIIIAVRIQSLADILLQVVNWNKTRLAETRIAIPLAYVM